MEISKNTIEDFSTLLMYKKDLTNIQSEYVPKISELKKEIVSLESELDNITKSIKNIIGKLDNDKNIINFKIKFDELCNNLDLTNKQKEYLISIIKQGFEFETIKEDFIYFNKMNPLHSTKDNQNSIKIELKTLTIHDRKFKIKTILDNIDHL